MATSGLQVVDEKLSIIPKIEADKPIVIIENTAFFTYNHANNFQLTSN